MNYTLNTAIEALRRIPHDTGIEQSH